MIGTTGDGLAGGGSIAPAGSPDEEGMRVDGGGRARGLVIATTAGILALLLAGAATTVAIRTRDGGSGGPAPGKPPSPSASATPGGTLPPNVSPLPAAFTTAGAETVAVDAALDRISAPGTPCPGTVRLVGRITVTGGAATVSYRWVHSDGRATGAKSVTVADGTTVRVPVTWSHDRTSFGGESRLQVLAPGAVTSAPVSFGGRCLGKASVQMPAGQVVQRYCGGGPPADGALIVRARISVSAGPQVVAYSWNDGRGELPTQQVEVPSRAEPVEVVYRWPGYPDAPPDPRGTVRLVLRSPNSAQGVTAYEFRCASPSFPPSPGRPGD